MDKNLCLQSTLNENSILQSTLDKNLFLRFILDKNLFSRFKARDRLRYNTKQKVLEVSKVYRQIC